MEDLSDYLKRHLVLFRKLETAEHLKDCRAKDLKRERRDKRHEKITQHRKIPVNMSPVTPREIRTRQEKPKEEPQPPPKVNKRLEMLAKWKIEKQKRLEEAKQKKKPIFKVTHVPVTVGLPNLENVNSQIKGKTFKSKFAPTNHKFRAPANIKPVMLNGMVTRSQSQRNTAPIPNKIYKTPEPKTRIENITPKVCISPFVTISRGKESARKEYEKRKSEDINGAAYFKLRLNNEINRLNTLCEEWLEYRNSKAEEIQSMIDVATGQTNLLITKKFQQFKNLIEVCENPKKNEQEVTCQDLHGFWDLLQLQIDNVNKRFENLTALKQNNWEEVLPQVTKEVKRDRKGVTKTTAKASAGLKEAIKAARLKKIQNTPLNKVVVESTRKSSPGLAILRVSQVAKSVETPGKSILKVSVPRSTRSSTKNVSFYERQLSDKENVLNTIDIKRTPRGRKVRGKIF